MKTIILFLTLAACSCHPLQTADPAGSTQFGVLNIFRGDATTGDTDKTAESQALVRSDHEENVSSTNPATVIETSSK